MFSRMVPTILALAMSAVPASARQRAKSCNRTSTPDVGA